jgi:D-serine deaminase-like pyridoxal phosphate-dependent protein
LLKYDLDTPFITADINKVKMNIQKMQKIASVNGKNLRPHVKSHKLPLLAHWQIEAGAIGVCVQKTAEAEVMVAHGIQDVLISNEVIGTQKTDRIARLASQSKMSIAVDSELGIEQISRSAHSEGVEIGVYVDVDVGMNRCGVNPKGAAILAELVSRSPNIYFKGIMGYDGHSEKPIGNEERKRIVRDAYKIVRDATAEVKTKGLQVDVVSVGGTPSSPIWAELDGITELQPGAYVYNDIMQLERGVAKSDCAVTLVATVMSKSSNGRAIIDAGSKSFALDQGRFPAPVTDVNGEVVSLSEEHAVIQAKSGSVALEVGQKLELIPYHICTMIDLWEQIHLCNGDAIIAILDVEARGART